MASAPRRSSTRRPPSPWTPPGNLFVADSGNNEIREINVSTNAVSLFAGSASGTAGSANGTGTAATFSAPSGIAIDSAGNLYVADTENSEIRMVTPGAVVTTYAGSTTAKLRQRDLERRQVQLSIRYRDRLFRQPVRRR